MMLARFAQTHLLTALYALKGTSESTTTHVSKRVQSDTRATVLIVCVRWLQVKKF